MVLALALLLFPVAGSAAEAPEPLAYRFAVTYDQAGFQGDVRALMDANGSLAVEGTLRGYLKGSGLGMNLRASYDGEYRRDAAGNLTRERSHVRVWDIDLGETRLEATETLEYRVPLRDAPTEWREGATWTQEVPVHREYQRDARAPSVSDRVVRFHFHVLGNQSFQVGGTRHDAWGVRMDTEPTDTDGQFNVSWVEPSSGLVLERSRFYQGKEVVKATLVEPRSAGGGDGKRWTPAPAAGLLLPATVLAALAGARRSRRRAPPA